MRSYLYKGYIIRIDDVGRLVVQKGRVFMYVPQTLIITNHGQGRRTPYQAGKKYIDTYLIAE